MSVDCTCHSRVIEVIISIKPEKRRKTIAQHSVESIMLAPLTTLPLPPANVIHLPHPVSECNYQTVCGKLTSKAVRTPLGIAAIEIILCWRAVPSTPHTLPLPPPVHHPPPPPPSPSSTTMPTWRTNSSVTVGLVVLLPGAEVHARVSAGRQLQAVALADLLSTLQVLHSKSIKLSPWGVFTACGTVSTIRDVIDRSNWPEGLFIRLADKVDVCHFFVFCG